MLHITTNYALQTLCCSPHKVCNEEGKLMGLPGNRRLGNDVIAGTFFLAGDTPDGDFCSLTQEQADRWSRHFAQPESFQPGEVERKIHIEFYTM